VQAEGGSLGTGLVKAGIGDKADNWSFRLGATYYATDSVPTLDTRYGGAGADPFHDSVVSGRATYDFTPDVQLDERAYWTESRVFYDGYSPATFLLANYPQYEDVRELSNYTGINFNFFDDRLKNRVAYEYTTTQHSDYNSAVDPITQSDSYRGDNSRVEYQGTWAIVDGYQAVFGVQQEKSWIDTTPYAPAHADTGQVGEYVQLQGEVISGLT
jgi:vitamin B12 transporter